MSNILKLGVTLPAGPSYPMLFNFLNPVSSLPVTASLVSVGMLGGNSAYTLANKVSGAADISVVGTPTLSSLGATCNQGNCYDSGVLETSAYTIIAVAKPIASGSGMLISNYGSAGNGLSLYCGATNTIDLASGTSGPNANTSLSLGTPTAGDWYIFSAKGDTTNQTVAFRHNGTLTRSSATATGSRAAQARNLRIGGHHAAGQFTSNVNVLMALIFNAKLSDADEASTLAAIASVLNTGAGITTL